jgi:hypothetical protein
MFAVLFISIMPFSIWWINGQHTVFKSEIYIDSFAEHDVYENITPLVLPALAHGAEQEQITLGKLSFQSIVENLDAEDWQTIAAEVVPPDYLQAQIEPNLQYLFDYMNGNAARLEVEFDTGYLRRNLLGQPGDRMINRIFQTWQPCTPDQEADIHRFLDEAEVAFPYCKPEDADLQREVFTLLNTAKDDLVRDIPETWNMREQYAERNAVSLQEADRFFYESIQRPAVLWDELFPLAILLPCSLLAMIVIFAVDSAKSFFRWMGTPLILTGIAVLLPLLFVPIIQSAPFEAQPQQTELEAIQLETLHGVVVSITNAFSRPVLYQGAGLVGLGFALLLISTLIPAPPPMTPYEIGSTASYPAAYAVHQDSQPTVTVTPTPAPDRTPSTPRRYKVTLDVKDADETTHERGGSG